MEFSSSVLFGTRGISCGSWKCQEHLNYEEKEINNSEIFGVGNNIIDSPEELAKKVEAATPVILKNFQLTKQELLDRQFHHFPLKKHEII